MHSQSHNRRFRTLAGAGLAIGIGLLSLCGGAARADTAASAAHRSHAAAKSLQFVYRLHPGETYRYHMIGFFNGHIPPFAMAPDPPVHLMTDLVYEAIVGARTDSNIKVKFIVSRAVVSLLEKDPGPDGKIDPGTETEFPVPIEEIQKALNVTAILRRDGSVAEVVGGQVSDGPPKINLGFDVRKLFLLIMPVIFPPHALSVGDEWTSDDGVLGHRPGKTIYTNRLAAQTPDSQSLGVQVDQTVVANVDDRLDKNGKPAQSAAETVDSTTGIATLKATLHYRMKPADDGSALANLRSGRLVWGVLTIAATMKRSQPSLAIPSAVLNSTLDVEARLTVRAETAPAASSATNARTAREGTL